MRIATSLGHLLWVLPVAIAQQNAWGQCMRNYCLSPGKGLTTHRWRDRLDGTHIMRQWIRLQHSRYILPAVHSRIDEHRRNDNVGRNVDGSFNRYNRRIDIFELLLYLDLLREHADCHNNNHHENRRTFDYIRLLPDRHYMRQDPNPDAELYCIHHRDYYRHCLGL